MFFASDNTACVHPNVLDALAAANKGHPHSYGADPIMDSVRQRIRDIFEAPEAAVFLVATGTAANALALATLTDPWGAVYCHRNAHIEEDECGAPEFYTGGSKLVLVDGDYAKMDPASLRDAIAHTARAGVHNVQRGMVSLTNVTEKGGVYSKDEVEAICAIAKSFDLPVHLDGARFANALVAAGCTPAEMTWRAGVDAVSFGGTKNGLMGVEAVVIFDPKKAWEFELRRKRGGHLFSKHRYLSAQMQAYLADDLWLDLAQTANDHASRLAGVVDASNNGELRYPTDANMVFADLTRAAHKRLLAAGADYYLWPFDQSLEGDQEHKIGCRLVCSWDTQDTWIDDFAQALG